MYALKHCVRTLSIIITQINHICVFPCFSRPRFKKHMRTHEKYLLGFK